MSRRVKREPADRSAASPVRTIPSYTNTMGPPSRTTHQKRDTPHEDMIDAQSANVSFIRSHAPSAETRLRGGERQRSEADVTEPMFLEMRHRGASDGHVGSPSSQNADASFAQQSFAHPTFTDIGMKLKACNDTLGDLQQLGVSHVAELPELVLVGDQSAGKSSLMSGLARVDLPRSAGVGTRCPLHIRLIGSNNAHWSCTVSLQLDYDFQPPPGGKIKKTDVTERNPFPPWVKKSHRDTKMFKTIFDPSEIEEVLRWAQVAVLNHNKSHELFIPGEGSIARETDLSVAASHTDAQFSPNIVALEIKGPSLPDLSFYDLPGVFLSPDQEEDEYVVKVVSNLTRDYIQRKKAIIMWALPMNVDSENSISLGIIREARAGDRTIGIMTKADKLAPGDESQWLAMFRREKQSVGHGFFATARPPDQEALENATRYEELFFGREIEGWPSVFEDFTDRCGVELLREYISVQLGNAFSRSLPHIKTKVYNRLQEIKHQLDGLPELPSNVEHEVKRSLYQFLGRMKTIVKEPDFSSDWGTLNTQFQRCIVQIKPTCRVKDTDPPHTIDLDADTDSSATPKRPRPSDSTVRGTPTKRVRQTDAQMPSPVKQESFSGPIRAPSIVSTGPPGSSDAQNPFARFANLGRLAMDIKLIRENIKRKQRPGLPRDLVPTEVRETMCLDAVKKWKTPLDMYITKTTELLERVADQALLESLGSLQRRMIFKECKTHLKDFITQNVALQQGRLIEL
ncbi:P-loop containing nucleoside triphosphate hydrolase protein [Xylariaceae sp. FL0016]|nr:P-loop containing nucleoside triphosphate hydrolase protein [Xylariaceae sp. FL0016]